MNTYPKLTEPFAFWLAQHFLPIEDSQDEEVRPISNSEFYISIGMVGITLALYGIILHIFGA